MKYTITKIDNQLNQNGEQKFDNYKNPYYWISVTDEEGVDYRFSKSFKFPRKVGDILEGELDLSGQFPKFIAAKTPPPSDRSGSGFNASGKKDFSPSPATEVPYLSLKAAVEFAGAKVSKGLDITGEQVVVMAKVFQQYLNDELKPQSPTQPPPPPFEEDFSEEGL